MSSQTPSVTNSSGASSVPPPSSTPASVVNSASNQSFSMPLVGHAAHLASMMQQSSNPANGSNLMSVGSMVAQPPSQPPKYGNYLTSPELEKIHLYVQQLLDMETRETALMELSRKREHVPDMALTLWNSFGAITALLLEIISVYPTITPPTLNAHQSNRVCNALALLQCVASHPDTRGQFLQANIPLYLYPFLNINTSSKTRPFEYLRLTSLGVIGALVKTDEKEVINFLLKTEIIPLCLRIMESGTELSKTVATFILQKILLDETGLNYICHTYDRFSHVAVILAKMVITLAKEPSIRLLKHVIRCYLRLSDNPRAREAMRHCLPDQLRTNHFHHYLRDDRTTKGWLVQLHRNIEVRPQLAGAASTGEMNGGGGAGSTSGQTSPSPSSMLMAMGGAPGGKKM